MCLSIFCGSPEELWTAPPPSPPVRLVTKHPNYIILWDSCLMQLFQALEPFLFISFLQLHFLSAGIRNVILLRSHWLKELWKGLLVLGSAGCGFSMVVVVEERLGTAWKVTSYTNLTCPKHSLHLDPHTSTFITYQHRKQGVFVWSLFVQEYKWIKSAEKNSARAAVVGAKQLNALLTVTDLPLLPCILKMKLI